MKTLENRIEELKKEKTNNNYLVMSDYGLDLEDGINILRVIYNEGLEYEDDLDVVEMIDWYYSGRVVTMEQECPRIVLEDITYEGKELDNEQRVG